MSGKRKQFIEKLRREIEKSNRGRKQQKQRTFLDRLGIKRRTPKAVREVNGLLQEYGIEVAEDGSGLPWDERNKDARLTFVLDGQSRAESSHDGTGVVFAGVELSSHSEIAEEAVNEPKVDGQPLGSLVEPATRPNKNVSHITSGNGQNPRPLFKHQRDAIHELDKHCSRNSSPFAGMLVIPTGGGKTRTAVDWLLRNVVDKGGKVLWVAHRHELLEL